MKLLASDFDNTLLFDNQMKEKDVKKIKEFQKKGHLFGVCTGRSLKGVLLPSQPYHLTYDFYILLSGSLIIDKNLNTIYHKTIPLKTVEDIFHLANHVNASVVYQDEMYIISSTEDHQYRGVRIHSFSELDTKEVTSMSFHFKDHEIKKASKLTQIINEQYGHIVTAFQNNQHIDIAAKGCSKGEGIHFIQEYFHLSPQDIHVIGDSWNDLPMIDAVKNSYTFTYAHVDIQNRAKTIVETLTDCIEDIEKSL